MTSYIDWVPAGAAVTSSLILIPKNLGVAPYSWWIKNTLFKLRKKEEGPAVFEMKGRDKGVNSLLFKNYVHSTSTKGLDRAWKR